ncbi:MAG: hypothetical protein Q8P12_06430, partial [bacterium]|nr:hypothetical protein [bacterium]
MRTRTRRTLSLATMVVLAILSGCGGGGGSSSGDVGGASSGNGTALPAKTLSWAAPESYTDNTSLNPVTDLEGFEIYVNESGSFADADAPNAVVSAVDPATHTLTTSFNLANLAPYLSRGIAYQVSMRAVAVTGLKSDFSPPASFSFCLPLPRPSRRIQSGPRGVSPMNHIEGAILSSFRAGIVAIRSDGTVAYINPIGAKILEVCSLREGENIHPRAAENVFFRVLSEALTMNYLPTRAEAELPGRDGERQSLGFTLSELKEKDGRVGICAFFKDLTHVEMAEESEDLKQRLLMLGQMAAGLAHEIRNPIAS